MKICHRKWLTFLTKLFSIIQRLLYLFSVNNLYIYCYHNMLQKLFFLDFPSSKWISSRFEICFRLSRLIIFLTLFCKKTEQKLTCSEISTTLKRKSKSFRFGNNKTSVVSWRKIFCATKSISFGREVREASAPLFYSMCFIFVHQCHLQYCRSDFHRKFQCWYHWKHGYFHCFSSDLHRPCFWPSFGDGTAAFFLSASEERKMKRFPNPSETAFLSAWWSPFFFL